MNAPQDMPPHPPEPAASAVSTLSSLVTGMRWFAAFVVAAATLFPVRVLAFIPGFRTMFQDMLGPNIPLPLATAWLIRSHPFSLVAIVLLSLLAIVCVFRLRSPRAAFLLAGAAVMFDIVAGILVSMVLFLPISTILQKMSE